MIKEEHAELRNIIEAIIEEIEAAFPYLQKETQAIAPSGSLGRLTRMEALSEKGVNEYVLSQNRKIFDKLHNALSRMNKGSYGTCLKWGNEIPSGRLRLVPEALVCVPCSSKN